VLGPLAVLVFRYLHIFSELAHRSCGDLHL